MIGDLHLDVLPLALWGYKVSRLNEVARLGLATVPPALCIIDAPTSRDGVAAWLRTFRPARVVVRTSSTAEDGADVALAGRTQTVLNCPPDADAITRVLREDVAPRSRALGRPSAYVVQTQIDAAVGGVAFGSRRRVAAEAVSGSTTAVTSGLTPEVRFEWLADDLVVNTRGAADQCLPVLLIATQLRRAVARLREHFGWDVDVEWAWHAGELVVLQVRPMTRPLAGWSAA